MIRGRRWAIACVAVASVLAGAAGLAAATGRHLPGSGSGAGSAASTASAASLALTASRSNPATAPTTAPASPVPTATREPKPLAKRPKPKPKPARTTTPPARSSTNADASTTSSGRIRFGKTYTGIGTFYAATGAGNCSYAASDDLMVGAMNHKGYDGSRACGDYLAVTGPNGHTITIKVVDQCPECPPGAIDLSRQAFAKLAAPSAGRIAISWRLVSQPLGGPVEYRYKSGSSQYWCGIQVLNHRNPVASLEVKVNGGWKSLPRLDYNYFVSTDGSGCGADLRITDIAGHRLTDTGIRISPDAVQRGHAQFGPA